MAFLISRIKPLAVLLLYIAFSTGTARFFQPEVLSAESPPVRARLSERVGIHASGRGRPLINFADGCEMITAFSGNDMLRRKLESAKVYPLSLASDDFDEDGVADLACGYEVSGGGVIAVYRGNVDAIYPNSPEARLRKAQGAFTDSPFLAPAWLFSTPEPAALIVAGDFDADGHRDLVAASERANSIYLYSGNGRGEFANPRSISLPGRLTSMIAGEMNRRDGLEDIVVAVETVDGASALVFEGPQGALQAAPEEIALPAPAASLALGQIDEDHLIDLAVAASSSLIIVHGRDRKLSLDEREQKSVGQARLSEQELGFELRSMRAGDFRGDHRLEMALLSEDGTVYISSRTGAKWNIEEMAAQRWPGARDLVKLRAASAKDALTVIDEAARRLRVIGSEDSADLDVEGEPVAALEMRLNGDAQGDLVILRSGESSPSVLLSQPGATFTVTNTNGFGAGSLFEAILDANETPGADLIAFNIPGPGPHTINQTLELPTATEPVMIDATTQPGFAGTPIITIKNVGAINGIILSGGNSTIRGFVINGDGFANTAGIRLISIGGNIVEGNIVGTDISGTGLFGHSVGMRIIETPNNTIGGTAFAARNTISGNTLGMTIEGNNATGNLAQGNFIGPRPNGIEGLGNVGDGVQLFDTPNNTIGGTAAGARNVISSNSPTSPDSVGIRISGGNATGNLVQGNFIGTDATGSAALGNRNGIFIEPGANGLIGGTAPGSRNVISGNNNNGVFIGGAGNLVQGNFIGTDVSGTASLSNLENGVIISSVQGAMASGNVIGGTTVGARNVISGNGLSGVLIDTPLAIGNSVQGNFIGTDFTGTAALGNGLNGVTTTQAPNNTIGGVTEDARNIISANGRHGVSIGLNTAGGATGITVQNNFIGTAADGVSCLGNLRDGVFINSDSVTHIIIDNLIACNARNGVNVPNFAAANPGIEISILRNSIHTNTMLGIDIGDAGVTPNDAADPDIGANNLQNFPILTMVTFASGNIHIVGNLNSTPNTDFFVQFFSSSECSGSNPGQNQQLLNSLPLLFTTDASGNAPIDVNIPITPVGGWVNALATDPAGNSSEFSPCTPINGSCNFVVSPTSQMISPAGGGSSVSVTTTSGCNWTATSNDSWIQITSGGGAGSGSVFFSVEANTGPARAGTMTVAGQTVAVTQGGGCAFSLAPQSESFGAAGGSGNLSVTTEAGCSWTATSNDSFITITSGHTGTGSGTIFYLVAANSGPARTGTITIADQTFTTNQASGCLFTIDRSSQSFAANGGAGSFTVTTTPDCNWTAVSNDPWIQITSGDSGTGIGTVQYSVTSHSTTSARSGSITVAGLTFTVLQGAAFADVPQSHPFYTEIGKLSARGVTL
ncbi:MAG TPA: FG-GAP-like repeat-containing protein, partial [Blastocatellia bacterium]|nr:FG-GAP-like repeat-containing protein [Blastocatellia bacterium]